MSLIVKKKINEDPYPKKTEKELMKGSIIVIDKPKGPFSYEVTDKVKKVLKAKKTGHAGTLDPNATGVLPIGVNKGCHLLRAISKAPKAYDGVMHLHTQVSLTKVKKAAEKFIGKIIQKPPVRSAVKREEREREVYLLKVNDLKGRDVYFSIKCEAGTYVRKICSDWGEAMGINSNLKELRRTLAGPYTLKDTVKFEDFLEKPKSFLKPLESAVTHLNHLWIDDNTVKSMGNGSQPFLPGVYKFEKGIEKEDLIALMNTSQELVALGTALMTSTEMKKSKGQVARIERVFIRNP